MHLTNKLSVMSLLGIIKEISDADIRLVIGRNRIMLIRRLISKGIIEVVHHVIGVSLVAPHKNLIIGIRLLNVIRVAAKELLRS